MGDTYTERMIKFLESQDDIEEMVINSDLEPDYHCFALSGIMIKSNRYLYPIAAGFDIGCGVSVFRTDIGSDEISRFYDHFHMKSPFGIRRKKYVYYSPEELFCTKIGEVFNTLYLGDIEEGNHFIEIRTCDGQVYLLIHSGIPEKIKNLLIQYFFTFVHKYSEEALESNNSYLVKVDKESEDAKDFIRTAHESNAFASKNRKYIAEKIIQKMGGKILDELDSSHEFIEEEDKAVVHCFGAQRYKVKREKMLAAVLCKKDTPNYIVERTGMKEFINHGTAFIDRDGNRAYGDFFELIQQDRMNEFKPVRELRQACSCKRSKQAYVYKVF